MKYKLEMGPDHVIVELSPQGRAVRALTSAAKAFAVSLVLMLVFYLPDILADYGQRSNFIGFFASYLVLIAGLVAGVAGALSALSRYRFEIDSKRGYVRWFTKTSTGRTLEDELDFDQIRDCVRLNEAGTWSRSRIELILADDARAPVASKRVGLDELDLIRAEITKRLEPR